MEKYVFLSYSSKDYEKAFEILKYLESNNIKCWIAPRDILGGNDYRGEIIRAIIDCSAFIFVASSNSNMSNEVSTEVSVAFSNKKNIQVFIIEDVEFNDDLKYNIGSKQWINATVNWNESLKKLLLSLKVQSSSEIKNEITREYIADYLKNLTRKYSYCLLNRISNDEELESFCIHANKMFSLISVGLHKNTYLAPDTNYINLMVDCLSNSSHKFTIQGRPGIGKNMLAQLVFLKLLKKFVAGKIDVLPVYLSSAYYEKDNYDNNVDTAMKNSILEDLECYFKFLQQNKDVKPIVILEGIREYSFSNISPEKIIFDVFKDYGNYGRVITIDTGLINAPSRLKKIIAIARDPREDYYIKLDAIPIEFEANVKLLIDCVSQMYTDEFFQQDALYNELKRLEYSEIDIFLVRFIAHEMVSYYDRIGSVSDMYYRFISREYDDNDDRINYIAKNLFEYLFFEGEVQSKSTYDGQIWSFPNKHHTYLGYLLAYYVVKQIQNYESLKEFNFFKVILSSVSNQFIVSMLNNNYALQNKFKTFIETKFDGFNNRQKCNATYWLGRLNCNSRDIKNFATTFLTNLLTKLKPLIINNNKPTLENLENHMLFRSICTGLMHHDQANMLDEYLCLLISNDIANAVNRGASIEYFGEGYQIGGHDTINLDNDYSIGEKAIKALCARVESALKDDNNDKFVENNLVTLLMLLQARIQSNSQKPISYNIDSYVINAQNYLSSYKTKPHNFSSQKIKDYLDSVSEDLDHYSECGKLDVATVLYNKLQGLKYVKRAQWHSMVEDSESVSEHMFGAWMLAMFFLPEEYENQDNYNKKDILDMLLIHNFAQIENENAFKESTASYRSDTQKNEYLRKMFLKGTYPNVANLTRFYDLSVSYCNNTSLNARIAHDINILQTVYTFFEYLNKDKIPLNAYDINDWLKEKEHLQTPLVVNLFDRLITSNSDFKRFIVSATKK